MNRIVYGAIALALNFTAVAWAQNPGVNDVKGKIFDAQMAQKLFARGLKYCKELDGTNFYFEARDRVLSLDEFHRSLDNLAREGVFNPVTHRPWSAQDADARWQQVQKEAVTDRANCELVASLPDLQKKLDDLQKQPGAPQTKN
jgi:hypothetical protein